MSLLLLEGFDDGLYADRATQSSASAGSSAYNRLGLAYKFNDDTQILSWSFSTDGDPTVTYGAHMTSAGTARNPDNRFDWQSGIRFTNSDGLQIFVIPDVSGDLIVFRGTGTELDRTVDPVFASVWDTHYIEVKVNMHDSTGSVEVWVDGAKLIDFSGDTHHTGANPNIEGVDVRVSPIQPWYWWLDDLYITNGVGAAPYNGVLGDIIVDTIFPDGNGFHSDFVGSDADSTDNYLLVDENPHDSDTTYVESGTATDRDSYTFDDLDLTEGTILGVMATAVSRNVYGGAQSLQLSTRVSSTDYDGPTVVADPTYGLIEHIWQISPDTSVDWTRTEVNGAEFGMEKI